MALSNLQDALNQYNANIVWQGNAAKAQLAYEAIMWLLINRPQKLTQGIRTLDYDSLQVEAKKLEEYIWVTSGKIATFTVGKPKEAEQSVVPAQLLPYPLY
jgi:hypothetical protein